MQFISTRGRVAPHSFSEAVAAGLAPDGGLFIPESLPDISAVLKDWEDLPYPELCFKFLRLFASDFDVEKLRTIVEASYKNFEHPAIAPLKELDKQLYVLELFHGPTLAFKDFALQLLGNLYDEQIRRTDRPINVLGATSGDTGSAAIHGLLGREGVHIFVLYPEGRISTLQERQMTCTGASNVFPIAIEGTFDDAQRMVKDLLAETEFKQRYGLSAVNSINIARILAQSVYYVYAWLQLPKAARKAVEFVVPTGNFGNVLAGWWTQRMGLPVRSFKIATNQNDVLYRLFTTGSYQVRSVTPSCAPSMDIQKASNFERFLYYAKDCRSAKVRKIMRRFNRKGYYKFRHFDADTFNASSANDSEIGSIIRSVNKEFQYTVDPHTACGFKDLNPDMTSVVLATAHPAKFPDVIAEALDGEITHPRLEALKTVPMQRYCLSADLTTLRDFIATNAKEK